MGNLPILEELEFTNEIEEFSAEERVHADTFNKRLVKLFGNLLFLKKKTDEHEGNKENPHKITKDQIGLSDVINVSTNDQTPTYNTAATLETLTSGEKLSVSFGKIAKAISDYVSHKANKNNPHGTTKTHVGLGKVDNTKDSEKPVSTLQRTAIDEAYAQATGYADQKIADLIGGAPSTLDTLKEIADAMESSQDVVEALDAAVGSKAPKVEVDSHIGNNTIHITASERESWNGMLPSSGGDAKDTVVNFEEAAELTELVPGSKMSVLFGKLKLAVKNLISLINLIGNTDISTIGNGTITGGLSELNSNIQCGNSAITQVPAGAKQSKVIAFSQPFSSPPVVVVSGRNNYPEYYSDITVDNITTHGFTVHVKNNYGYTGDIHFSYIAILKL